MLVDQAKLTKAVELATNQGYRCEKEVYKQVLKGAFFKHELALWTETYSAVIDLHIRPTGSSGNKAFISIEEARENAKALEFDGAHARLARNW